MSGKTSPTQIAIPHSAFYGAPAKKSRLQDIPTTGNNNSTSTKSPLAATITTITISPTSTTALAAATIRPSFKSLKDNLIKFDKKLAEPIGKIELTETKELQETSTGEESKSLDRDSPLPLKNLGNTCYENSIIQCLFSLNMFMDNFEQSMKDVRQFVTKPKVKTFDVCSLTDNKENPTSVDTTNVTITEDDVRYRIADAFYKLYNSYTHRRNQIDNQTVKDVNPKEAVGIKTNNQTDSAIGSQSNEAIPLCRPQNDTNQIEKHGHREDPHLPTLPMGAERTQDESSISAPNLTPIALVSSTPASSEQSEIETRLEDLKSAVGERSSQFNSTHQQDASEFFYHVIDSIQEFYQGLDMTSDEDNPVTKAFELELDHLIRCPKCHHQIITEPEKIRTLPLALPHIKEESNHEDYTHESSGAPTPPTSDLGLDSPTSSSPEELRNGSEEKENEALFGKIPKEDNNAKNTMSIAKLELTDKSEHKESSINTTVKRTYTLCDALNNYFKYDLLDYNCSQVGCDSKQRTKRCLIKKLPQVLFITLARYSYSGKKNLDEVEAPFELAVPLRENRSPSHSPKAYRDPDEEDNVYQLVAVVCHLGSSLNAGHYTSYVYNQNNFSWYCCDDDSITKVQEADVKNDATKSGYCFFYAKKSCINQNSEVDHKSIVNLEEIEQFTDADTIAAISSSVANSSVIMTPESSPKSNSNSKIRLLEDVTYLHEDHTRCMDGRDESMDDW